MQSLGTKVRVTGQEVTVVGPGANVSEENSLPQEVLQLLYESSSQMILDGVILNLYSFWIGSYKHFGV